MKRQKLLIILMWLALLFLGAGCASFSQDRLPPVTDLPQKFRGNTSVGIQVNWTVKVIQEYMTTQNQFLLPALEARKIFVKVFRESGWFAGVEAGGGSDPDIQVDIHMLNYGEVYPMQTLIAGLTLCLWPTWAADHYRMEATVTERLTGKTRTYKMEETLLTRFQLFLLFVSPFQTQAGALTEIQENMARHLLLRVAEDGFVRTSG